MTETSSPVNVYYNTNATENLSPVAGIPIDKTVPEAVAPKPLPKNPLMDMEAAGTKIESQLYSQFDPVKFREALILNLEHANANAKAENQKMEVSQARIMFHLLNDPEVRNTLLAANISQAQINKAQMELTLNEVTSRNNTPGNWAEAIPVGHHAKKHREEPTMRVDYSFDAALEIANRLALEAGGTMTKAHFLQGVLEALDGPYNGLNALKENGITFEAVFPKLFEAKETKRKAMETKEMKRIDPMMEKLQDGIAVGIQKGLTPFAERILNQQNSAVSGFDFTKN